MQQPEHIKTLPKQADRVGGMRRKPLKFHGLPPHATDPHKGPRSVKYGINSKKVQAAGRDPGPKIEPRALLGTIYF